MATITVQTLIWFTMAGFFTVILASSGSGALRSQGVRKCANCLVDKESRENATREIIKKDILKKLGMVEAPSVRISDHVPRKLLKELMSKHSLDNQMQRDQGYGGDSEDDVNTEEIFVMAKKPADFDVPDHVLAEYGVNLQYFPVETADSLRGGAGGAGGQQAVHREVVRKALLQIHLPRAHSDVDRLAWVTVSYVEVNSKGPSLIKSNVVSTQLDLERGGWVDIDVTEVVRMWATKGSYANYGLHIRADTSTGRSIPVGVRHQRTNVPYIHIWLDSSRAGIRSKRSTNGFCKPKPAKGVSGNALAEAEEDEIEECCVHNMYVDFKDTYGWEFIISPSGFEFNYCSGDCTLGMPSTTHAHIKQLTQVGQTCCTAQKLSGLEMLYLDHNYNVVLGNLKRMKVERCGCA